MNIETDPRIVEAHLMRETDRLDVLLQKLRRFAPQILISESEWEEVAVRARGLPAAAAAYPFGFELRLDLESTRADLGVSVITHDQARSYWAAPSVAKSDTTVKRIKRLLKAFNQENSELREVAADKLMLEYDLVRTVSGSYPDAALFIYAADDGIHGEKGEAAVAGMNLLLDELYSTVGWTVDERERQCAALAYNAAREHQAFKSFGVFPARGKALRLGVDWFRRSSEVVEYLDRINWSPNVSEISSYIAPFDRLETLEMMSVHFDVTEDGIGTKAGVGLINRQNDHYWEAEGWNEILRVLDEQGLVVSTKLSELTDVWCGLSIVFGRRDAFVLARGISHLKLTFTPDGEVESVKAYVYMVLSRLK